MAQAYPTTAAGAVDPNYTFTYVPGTLTATPAAVTMPALPPPVTVTGVHWAVIKVKVGSGKKAKMKSETVLEVDFSGSVSGAGNLGAYQLSSMTTKKAKNQHVTTMKPIKLSSAIPASTPLTTSVELVTAAKPNLAQSAELQITAADLTDALDRALDGQGDGQPGGNFIRTFSKQGLTPAQS